MRKAIQYTTLFLFLLGCVEPYEFLVKDNEPRLVVEGFISNKSFNETLTYPSDGRFFTVKLSYTSDVINLWGATVNGASVQLIDDTGGVTNYAESGDGLYTLLDSTFKAVPERKYMLRVVVTDEDVYESSWESLPIANDQAMGDVGFLETERNVYKYEAGEQVIKNVKGIETFIGIPGQNKAEQTTYYMWDFTPHWIYNAPLASSISGKKCWAVNPLYLSDYVLREDRTGGYNSKLFFVETIRNERIYDKFSVLIRQFLLSEEHYFFLKEMQERNQGGLLTDIPPYNLQTNMKALNEGKGVVGYFAVVNEQARRWYFSRKDLSYYVDDTLLADCLIVYGPDGPAPQCLNCVAYTSGDASNEKPTWWEE